MYVTTEEVVHMKRNISFLSSCAKCLIIVSVCPGKLFACADGSKHVAPGSQKAILWETSKIIYFVLEGVSFGKSFPKLEL